jgi:hypothetical protein
MKSHSSSRVEREVVQHAVRRKAPPVLSSRDACILGLPSRREAHETKLGTGEHVHRAETLSVRRHNMILAAVLMDAVQAAEQALVHWVNSKLPSTCPRAQDLSSSFSSGLILFRLAEAIKETDCRVPDSMFSQGRVDGLFKLFDFLLENDVRMGAVSINDIRSGNPEKIVGLVYALRSWAQKRTGRRTKSR